MRILKFLLFGALCAPNILLGQPKNRISIQTGLVHCFFDNSPLMNLRYTQKNEKPFNGVLINSVGLKFERKIQSKSSISGEFMNFFEGYTSTFQKKMKNQVYERAFNTVTINFNRFHAINNKIDFTYGGGINYRFGQEVIIVDYSYFNSLGYESLNEVVKRSDFGINIIGGIEYKPVKWMTLYSKLDFLGFVYMSDKKSRDKLNSVYGMDNYPNRFDLSLKLGIGFNF